MRLTTALITFLFVGAIAAQPGTTTTVTGTPTHGANWYNGYVPCPLDAITNDPTLNSAVLPFWEVFIPTPGFITAASNRAELVVTGSFLLTDFLQVPAEPQSRWGKKYLDPGTNGFFSTNAQERIPQVNGEDCKQGDTCKLRSNIPDLTLGTYEAVRGKATVVCHDDGTSEIEMTMLNGIPQMLYTLWEVGEFNALDDPITKPIYVVPLGGMPNVVESDLDGCAHSVRQLNYCPTTPCEVGLPCAWFFSYAMHPDGVVYGGSSANMNFLPSAAIGEFVSNHIVYFTHEHGQTPVNWSLFAEDVQDGVKISHGCKGSSSTLSASLFLVAGVLSFFHLI